MNLEAVWFFFRNFAGEAQIRKKTHTCTFDGLQPSKVLCARGVPPLTPLAAQCLSM